MKMMTRKVLAGVAAAVLGCSAFVFPAGAQGRDPVRIGVPTALSGPFSVLGEQVKRSITFAVDEWNAKGGINGRKIEVRFADTEAKPDVGRKQAEQLALAGYNLLIGPISSGESLAIGPLLERWDAVYVVSSPKSTKITGDSCQARMFRVAQDDGSDIAAVKGWLQSRKEKKWVAVGTDIAWGHDAVESFEKAMQQLGGKVVKSLFPARGATDFASYIQQIKEAAPEGVFVAVSGGDAINFINQAKQFGLLNNVTMAGVGYNYDVIVDAAGANANGIWGTINYSATVDTPANQAFVTAWKAAHKGAAPTDYDGQVYAAVSTLLQAVKKGGSSKPADVARELERGTFETPLGMLKMRAEDHQMIMPNYFGRVSMVDGKARNAVMMTLPAEAATPPADPACKNGNRWR